MSSRYQRFLVPIDGTAGDEQVLDVVTELVHQHQVSVTLIYVVEVQQSMPLDAELPNEINRGEMYLNRAEEFSKTQPRHKLSTVTTDLLQARSAGAAIVDEAIERRVDVIVLAATNRTRYGKVTMGDTINYVLKNAPCDVIVVRLAPEASPA